MAALLSTVLIRVCFPVECPIDVLLTNTTPAGRVFPIKNLSDVDATLLEPASCAAHGLDKIAPKMGSSVLMFGAGPTGLVLAQMLRQNGGCHVVIAAPEGLKIDLAKSLDAADVYVPLSRSDPKPMFDKIKSENPYGFDIVVEATGSVKILEDAINYVRRGGKLVVYGVYSGKDRVTWPPSKICKIHLSPPQMPNDFFLENHVLMSFFQSAMRSPSSAPSPRRTSSPPPSTISTAARSRSTASSTRPSSWISGRSVWRPCGTRAPSRPPSPLTRVGRPL